jgi:hypothetical protein
LEPVADIADVESAKQPARTVDQDPGSEGIALGPNAAQILATEHWSLLGTRTLIWNEALSRTTVFLTLLSATIIALALLADATGFGPHTTVIAMVLLPVVFLLGIAAYGRVVQINTEEFQLVMAMNRVRRAYLELEPGLAPYFSTGHTDDEHGLTATYMLYGPGPSRTWLWIHFIVNTPTIIATVDAAIAAAVVVLILQAVQAPAEVVIGAAGVVFLAISVVLFVVQFRVLARVLDQPPRFPTPNAGSRSRRADDRVRTSPP